MAMVTLSLPCNTNLSQTLSLEDNNLRDASFPSDLNGSEGTLVLKLAKSSQNLDSLMQKENVEDAEIGVFEAEKYFNGAMDEKNPRIDDMGATRHRYEKDEPAEICPIKTKTQLGTPSVHSGSNWSQSALLHFVQRNSPQRKTSKLYGKSLLASIGSSCSCCDKNSVDIYEHVGGDSSNGSVPVDLARTNKSRLDPWVMEDMHCKNFDEFAVSRKDCYDFRFPVLNPKKGNRAVKIQSQEEKDDKPRKSLEVFGSPILKKGKNTPSHGRMLTWDAIPKVEETETSAIYDGMHSITGSDSSSDLFELDSFTNNANTFRTSQASDGISSCVTPTTCYDPSEASIDWSVVTATATDVSVMSNSWELRAIAAATNPNRMVLTGKGAAPSRQIQRPHHSLLGCRNDKAVTVAGYAYRTSEKAIPDPRRRHGTTDSFAP
ncbi:protein PHYTOCHROME KINASE SUBSTRATE 1-like [Cornus florida]|uniref:protein PHYTOCHROME KINASE SUBSTRATE 1-like n=1 Tax=Cornus florida TaxID=4283 RepID=UPI002898FD25|nr:protein PHYTOCHROME KINASE SUBSTRATE 1-like [Cornus florida]